jgi:hypothetical protein
VEPILISCLRRRQRKTLRTCGGRDARQGLVKDWYKQLEWSTNEILQQHRLAHEYRWSNKTWKNCTEYVPVTAKGEVLAPLDVRDREHPVLYSPRLEYGYTEMVLEHEKTGVIANESPVSELNPPPESPDSNIQKPADLADIGGGIHTGFLHLEHQEGAASEHSRDIPKSMMP